MNKKKILSILMSLLVTSSLSTTVLAGQSNPVATPVELVADAASQDNIVNATQGQTVNFKINVSVSSALNQASQVSVNTNYHLSRAGITSSTPSTVTLNSNTTTATIDATIIVDNDFSIGNTSVIMPITVSNSKGTDKVGVCNNVIDQFTVNVLAGDATAPVVTIASPTNNGFYNASSLPTDPSYNVVEANQYTTKVDGWDSSEGTHIVTVTATDVFGNIGSANVTYTVDKTAPSISTVLVDGGIYNSTTLQSLGKYYTVQDANFDTESASILEYTEGNHTATITASDKAGNITTKIINYVVDNTAPMITFNFNDGGFYTSTFSGFNPFYNVVDEHLDSNSVDAPNLDLSEGNHSVTVSASDLAGNSNSASASYNVDDTAPTVTIKLDSQKIYNKDSLNALGDYYTAEDTNLINVDAPVLEKDTDGQYDVIVSATDKAGNNTTKTVKYNVDNTKPVVVFNEKLKNGGFYKSSDLESMKDTFFTVTDAHLVSTTATNNGELDLTEGSHTVSVTAVDAAGNETSESISYTIDNTAPEVNFNISDGSILTTDNLNKTLGENAYYTASDNIGVVSVVADQIQTSEGTYTLNVIARDAAGNETTKSVTYTVDNTAPTISGAPTTSANAAGWYNSDVNVHFTASDNLANGVANVTPDQTISTEGANQSATGTATDKAGNSSTATVSGINIDKTAPTINVENGGTYTLNQVVTWSASDKLSGLATVANGTVDTSKVGPKSQTIIATDNAGNTITKTISYTVKYNFGGILDPINIDGSSVFKVGSTIPVKFNLKDALGAYGTMAAAKISYAKISDNVVGTDIEAVSTSAATTGNLFRYDSTSNQYIFNMSTKGLTAGTYRLTITLDDGKSYTVQISLK